MRDNRHVMALPLSWVVIGLLLSAAWAGAAETQEDIPSKAISNLRLEPLQPLPLKHNQDKGKVDLGRRLFQDVILSQDGSLSCSSCHNLNKNGAGAEAHSTGLNGAVLDVNTLTVFNSGLNHRLFWDGRAGSLEEQIDYVMSNPIEFNTTWPEVVARLGQDPGYVSAFAKLYPDGITPDNIRDAISTFERSLITSDSRFDQYLRGDPTAINEREKAGYRLFKTYGCTACHQGANVGGNLFMKLGVFGDYFSDRGNVTPADLGRMNVTGDERDRHVFRVPSLRYVALTPPYFHDGSAETLEDAVRVMAKYRLGRKVLPEDIERIVAFLKTLAPEYGPQLLSDERPK